MPAVVPTKQRATALAAAATGGALASPSPHFLQSALFRGAILAVITIVAYLPAIQSGFIWDDDRFLYENPLIHAADGLRRFWLTTDAPDYFPLTSSMLWIEWRLFGMNATGYHVVNILLHIAGTLLIWRAVERLRVPGAWLAALVFALHPVNVESVAWITERKNTLSFFFFAASLSSWVVFEDNGRKRWYLFSLATFAAALLSKTSIVMLPCVLLLLAWWRRGRISRPDIMRTIPFFAIAGILSLVTIWFQYKVNIAHEVIRTDGLTGRLAGAGWAIWFYIYKAILPINLSFVYPRWQIDGTRLVAFMPLIALVAIAIALAIKRTPATRAVLVALLINVCLLFPVLGFFDIYFMRYSLVADHWQYIALFVPVILIVATASRLLSGKPFAAKYALSLVLVSTLFVLTWRAQGDYRDAETLWRETLKKNDQAFIAWNNLGAILQNRGELAEAERHYDRAIEAYPQYREAWFNKGHLAQEQNRFTEAVAFYSKAVEIDPKYVRAWNNLGNALHAEGKPAEAIEAFGQALELEPEFADALAGKAGALVGLGETNKAEELARRALEIDPENIAAISNIGMALAAQENYKEAAEHFERAVELQPNDYQLRYNLAYAYDLAGEKAQAIAHYSTVTENAPHLEPAWLHRGKAMLAIGQTTETIALWKSAIHQNPTFAVVAKELAWILATHPDPEIRDGEAALEYARIAMLASPQPAPDVLDTAAVAWATAEDFDLAVELEEQALALARQLGNQELANKIESRLTLFRAQRTYIDSKSLQY